jgi:hypothetical protein
MMCGGVMRSEMEIFALLIGAMVHDLAHDGMNNNFHKNARTERALFHNDISIQVPLPYLST